MAQRATAAVRNLAAEAPTGRIVYLDESLMRQIAYRLTNDPACYKRLTVGQLPRTPVTISSVAEAIAADPVFYAKAIWSLPSTDTLISIGMPQPPGSQGASVEPYPQAVVRARLQLPSSTNFTPERFTGLTPHGQRVTVLTDAAAGLSTNRTFLRHHTLFIIGTLRRISGTTVTAGAVLL